MSAKKDFGFKSRRSTAVVVGKFLPFHEGHKSLITRALKEAENVHVILVHKEGFDTVEPHVRALSIYEEFKGSNIKVYIVDDIYADDDTPESNKLWAIYTKQILGFTPHVVVASEDYGFGWAAAMGCDFVMHDADRFMIPVSGTLCRENAFKQSKYLPMATKRYMLPRVVVLGAESTGTTTLARDLAKHYDTCWVPELGHQIGLDALANGESVEDNSWNDGRFWMVSRGQDAAEENMARMANGLLICDTDSYATAVWYNYYMKKGVLDDHDTAAGLYLAGRRQARKHCLYILTSPEGVPFENDGTRTGEHLREWMHGRFINYLDELTYDGVPYIVVTGTPEERVAQAVEAIDKVVGND